MIIGFVFGALVLAWIVLSIAAEICRRRTMADDAARVALRGNGRRR